MTEPQIAFIAGGLTFYHCISSQSTPLIYWYTLSPEHTESEPDSPFHIDVRDLPEKYLVGPEFLRSSHQKSFEAAISDGYTLFPETPPTDATTILPLALPEALADFAADAMSATKDVQDDLTVIVYVRDGAGAAMLSTCADHDGYYNYWTISEAAALDISVVARENFRVPLIEGEYYYDASGCAVLCASYEAKASFINALEIIGGITTGNLVYCAPKDAAVKMAELMS